MSLEKTSSTNAFWSEFLSATGTIATDYTVAAFGDTPAMADELLGLVMSGRKRATASLLRDYATADDLVPQIGDFVVVVDGGGRPGCIWRTTEVVVKPLRDVDDAFAWDEGEGDRTRDWWLSAHRGYFAAQARREGFKMCDAIETVFERFEIVWPPGVAATRDDRELAMKPIRPQDRKIANIRTAAFTPWDAEGATERGTSILQLNAGQPKGVGFYIYRMEPGAHSAPHRHGGAEEFLMIEGELIDNDGTVYRPGDMVWLAPGTEHTSHSPGGCLIAVYAEKPESEVASG